MSQKCDADLTVLQFDLSVLQSDLFVPTTLQIEPMSDSLLYVKSIVAFLMLLLIVEQLFNDVLLSTPMTTTLMSPVVVIMTVDLM